MPTADLWGARRPICALAVWFQPFGVRFLVNGQRFIECSISGIVGTGVGQGFKLYIHNTYTLYKKNI
jgi:hypothetical protein